MLRLIPLVNAGLVLVLAYTLTQFTWLIWPAPTAAEKPPADSVSIAPVPAPTNPPQATASIAGLHLFGEPSVQAVAVVTAPPEPVIVPVTPLNLTLKGVVASESAVNARAIIADPGGKEDSYAINSQLPGEAVLKEIFPDHVVLLRNNQKETLGLVKDSQPSGVPDAFSANLPTALPTPEDVSAEAEFAEFADVVPPEEDAGQPELPPETDPGADVGSALRNYRDALTTNPQSLAGLAQAEPVQEDGKFKGYRVQPGSDPALFSSLGLEPGDVVTAVNGIALDNPARAFEIMQNLTTANEVQVVVNRNGQSRTLAASISE